MIVTALLYGGGDYGRSVCMSVETGFDTDYNGATVGSVSGMANRIGSIPDHRTKPINDTLHTSLFGISSVKISDRVNLTIEHINRGLRGFRAWRFMPIIFTLQIICDTLYQRTFSDAWRMQMGKYTCKLCGARLPLTDNSDFIICEYCETVHTVEELKGKTQKYERADVLSGGLAPYSGEQGYIFISYAHKNSAEVIETVERLQNDGCRVWYDEGITPGAEWDEYIAEKIENCGSFLAFISGEYLESDNCRDELNYARDLNKDVLLVYLTDVKLTGGMAMRLNRLQAIHKYTYPAQNDYFDKLESASDLKNCKN